MVFQLDHRPADLVALWRGVFEHAFMSEHVRVRVLMCACVTVHRWCLKDKCDVYCVSFFISQWGYGLIFPTDTLKVRQLSLSPSFSHTHTHTSTHTLSYKHRGGHDLHLVWELKDMKHYKVSHTHPHKFSNIIWHWHLQIDNKTNCTFLVWDWHVI